MLARGVRNVIYNYTDAQRKVRSATSNDAWGPSPALMHEIADLTDNVVAYAEIMPSKLIINLSFFFCFNIKYYSYMETFK
jgi:hypothetical protein